MITNDAEAKPMMETTTTTVIDSKTATTKSPTMAQMTWELSNDIQEVGAVEDLYKYNYKQQQDIMAAKPWDKE